MFRNKLGTGRTLVLCAIASCGVLANNAWAADIIEPEYKQGAGVIADIPSGNYQASAGEVVNIEDGLVWSRCLVGQNYVSSGSDTTSGSCSGQATEFNSWEEALAAVTEQQKADGWRVANIKELMRITDNRFIYPAIDRDLFLFANDSTYKHDDSYYEWVSAGSSPFIWSSTPTRHITTRKTGVDTATKAESLEATTLEGETFKKTYALDMSNGNFRMVPRDGSADGNAPDGAEVARYVLLVKTYQQ